VTEDGFHVAIKVRDWSHPAEAIAMPDDITREAGMTMEWESPWIVKGIRPELPRKRFGYALFVMEYQPIESIDTTGVDAGFPQILRRWPSVPDFGQFTIGGRWPCDRRIRICNSREMCVLSETGCRCEDARTTLCRISRSSSWPVEWTSSGDGGRIEERQASAVTITRPRQTVAVGKPGKRMALGSSILQQVHQFAPSCFAAGTRKKNAAKPFNCGFGTG
jgi:hypothetical protein